jgi:hypothetical protein
LIQVFFVYFFNWFFFQFHHSIFSTFDWLWIKFCHLFWFVLYEIILISLPKSWILRVNPSKLRSFYCVIFLNWFFFNFIIQQWFYWELSFIIYFNLFNFGLSWSHDPSQYFFKKNISSWIFLSQIIFLSIVQVAFELIKSIGSYRFNFDFFIFIWNFNFVIQVNLSLYLNWNYNSSLPAMI